MTKINNIQSIPVTQQRIIKLWYIYTLRIISVLIITLISITCLQRYYITISNKSCLPRIEQPHITAIQQKHSALHTQVQQEKEKELVQKKGAEYLHQYSSLLSAHTQKPHLTSLIDLQLTSDGLTAVYALNSLASVKPCIEDLGTVPTINKITFESLDQQNTKSGNTLCTLKATWKAQAN